MARNGSGTFSLVAGNPVVTGTIISSTVHNNTMTDIATALTDSVDKDGQTVITGSIDYNGNALILDADGDSKLQVSIDNRFDVTLGAVLSMSTTSAQMLLLDAIAKLTPTDSNIIVGNGTTFVAESGSTARTSLGVDLTTKGTILAGNGTAPAVLAAGTNGYLLAADSSTATGLVWQLGAVGNHEVIVTTGNGHGSTNTAIRRFTTTKSSVGTSITYADSAANGASFTINDTGVYAIAYSDACNTTGTNYGVSVNSAQLTTAIQSITAADRVSIAAVTSTNTSVAAFAIVALSAAAVIRPHTDASPNVTDPYLTTFAIRRIA